MRVAAAGGGINAVMGLDDPAGPGWDSGAVEIDGPLAVAPTGRARSDSGVGEPCAGREASGEPGPGTDQGSAAAAGRPPAGEKSQDEPFVSGDDDEDLPPTPVAAGGATADPVKDYLKQISKFPL